MNNLTKPLAAVVLALGAALASGCAPLVGAGAAAGAYEYQNKEQLEELEAAFERGELTREQYLERKEAIEEGSAVY